MVGRPPSYAGEEAAASCAHCSHMVGGRAAVREGSVATICTGCNLNLLAKSMPGGSVVVLLGAVEILLHTQGGGYRLRRPLL